MPASKKNGRNGSEERTPIHKGWSAQGERDLVLCILAFGKFSKRDRVTQWNAIHEEFNKRGHGKGLNACQTRWARGLGCEIRRARRDAENKGVDPVKAQKDIEDADAEEPMSEILEESPRAQIDVQSESTAGPSQAVETSAWASLKGKEKAKDSVNILHKPITADIGDLLPIVDRYGKVRGFMTTLELPALDVNAHQQVKATSILDDRGHRASEVSGLLVASDDEFLKCSSIRPRISLKNDEIQEPPIETPKSHTTMQSEPEHVGGLQQGVNNPTVALGPRLEKREYNKNNDPRMSNSAAKINMTSSANDMAPGPLSRLSILPALRTSTQDCGTPEPLLSFQKPPSNLWNPNINTAVLPPGVRTIVAGPEFPNGSPGNSLSDELRSLGDSLAERHWLVMDFTSDFVRDQDGNIDLRAFNIPLDVESATPSNGVSKMF
ncbi:hypothetical protein BJ170DRAFT_726698 [Xylariales sp. AK1849]|nr:hypothetical protein BJ170DRAFT_726698 [Xylariales sp. AK1849]